MNGYRSPEILSSFVHVAKRQLSSIFRQSTPTFANLSITLQSLDNPTSGSLLLRSRFNYTTHFLFQPQPAVAMSIGVSVDFYNARSQVDQQSSWASPVPAAHVVSNTGATGVGAAQPSPNGPQNSYQLSAQPSTPSTQSPAVPDDGQYHPNQQMPADKGAESNTQSQQGGKGLDSTSQQMASGQQTGGGPQTSGGLQTGNGLQTTAGQQGAPGGGQKTPSSQSQQSPSQNLTPAQNQDGQYHPDSTWNQQNSANDNSGQASHAHSQQQEGSQVQPNQQGAPVQHGSSMQADKIDQSNWNQAPPTTNDWSSPASSAPSPTATEKEPQHTSAEASTSAPSIPASQSSQSSDTSATSAAASAGIALAVIAALGLIAVLVLLPLYKKRKRLRKLLGHDQKVIIMEQPPKNRMQPVNEFMARSYSHSHRMVRSATGYLKSKRQPPPQFAQTSRAPSSSSRTSSNQQKPHPTVTAVQASHSTLPPTLHYSPPASFATWSTEGSKSSSNNSVAPSHDERQVESPTSNLGQFYGLGSAENLSMGNLVAVNPLMNKIYSVEMDYNSGKPGQLVLRVGQRLTILQVYDHGWVRNSRFASLLLPMLTISFCYRQSLFGLTHPRPD